jgi:hypothetical protein
MKADRVVYMYYYPDEHPDWPSQPCYVGKGSKDRPKVHLKGSHNKVLANLFRKYGHLRCVIVCSGLTTAEANNAEITLIRAIGRRDLGTGPLVNFSDGGEGLTNPSADTIRRLSESHAGQVPSEANHAAVRAAWLGRHHTEASREAIRSKNKGKSPSPQCIEAVKLATSTPEFADKQAELSLARWKDPAYRERMTIARRNRVYSNNPELSSAKHSAARHRHYQTLTAEQRKEIYGKSMRGKPAHTRGRKLIFSKAHREAISAGKRAASERRHQALECLVLMIFIQAFLLRFPVMVWTKHNSLSISLRGN